MSLPLLVLGLLIGGVLLSSLLALRQRTSVLTAQARELERLSLVARLTSNVAILCDERRRIVWVNDSFTRVTGYTPAEVIGRPPGDILQFEKTDRATVDRVRAAVAAGQPIRVEILNRGKNGREYWLDMEIQPVRDAAGRTSGFIAIETEITDRKLAQARLAESEARLTAFVEHAPAAVAMVDRQMRYLAYSRRWLTDYGLEGRDLIGRSHYDVFPEIPERWKAIHARVLAGGVESCDEDRFDRADGSVNWLRWEARPWRTAEGAIGGMLMLTEEVTAQRKVMDDLRHAREAAEAANRAKSEFLANMSHEIRTPMTAILGYADLLRRGQCEQDGGPTGDEALESIHRNAKHLLAIVNDILDLSKIEAGHMTLERTPTSPAGVVEEVISLLRVRASEKNLPLELAYETAIPRGMPSDPVRLRQILMNLVGNAIKFTPSGSVSIRVRLDQPGAPEPLIRFAIQDTGVGLPPEHIERLFQPFSQADTSVTRRFGGTGLGLSISRRLAEMLGGRIDVESTIGQGATFTLTLPTGPLEPGQLYTPGPGAARGAGASHFSSNAHPPTPTVPASTERPLHDRRILLVEDGPDNQRLIRFLLQKAGAHIDLADNGRIAAERLSGDGTLAGALRAPIGYDLILLDMQMPEMDGYATARWLRERGCAIPIIALTAHAMSGDRERCLTAGCSEYATKPIDKQTLLAMCARLLRPGGVCSPR